MLQSLSKQGVCESLYVCTVDVCMPCLSRLESPGDRGMAGAGLTGSRLNLDGTWPQRSFINTLCVKLFPPIQLPHGFFFFTPGSDSVVCGTVSDHRICVWVCMILCKCITLPHYIWASTDTLSLVRMWPAYYIMKLGDETCSSSIKAVDVSGLL